MYFYPVETVAGHVYLIQQGGPRGPVKIGHTKDLAKRIKALETGSPVPLVLIGSKQSDDAKRLEKSLHRQFRPHKLRGEWFSWCPEIEALAKEIATVQNPPARAGRFPWWKFRDHYRAKKRMGEPLQENPLGRRIMVTSVETDSSTRRCFRDGFCRLIIEGNDYDRLHDFAARLGVRRHWFTHPHYTLDLTRRETAIRLGAVEA